MKKQKTKNRRLFLALWPESDVRHQLYECQQMLKSSVHSDDKSKPVKFDNLHLTLRFLGAVDEALLKPLCAQLGKVHSDPFELQLQGLGYFARSRTLWLGLKQSQPALLDLNHALDQVLCELLPNFTPERKAHRPHVSLYRNADKVCDELQCDPIIWQVSEFVLVESLSTSTGVDYRVLQAWSLCTDINL